MSRIVLSAVALALFVAAQPVAAAVPVLSGKYVLSYQDVCPAGVTAQFQTLQGLTVVQNVSSSGVGAASTAAMIANFDPGTASVSLKGRSIDTSMVLVTNLGGTSGHAPVLQAAINASWPYSNDDSTVTLNGVVYQAAFGAPKKGITQSGLLIGINEGCEVTIRFWK